MNNKMIAFKNFFNEITKHEKQKVTSEKLKIPQPYVSAIKNGRLNMHIDKYLLFFQSLGYSTSYKKDSKTFIISKEKKHLNNNDVRSVIAKELKEKLKGEKQNDIADKLKIRQSKVSILLSAKEKMSIHTRVKMARKCGVNFKFKFKK